LSVSNGSTLNIANNNISVTHSGFINGNGETGRIGINGGNIIIASNTTLNSNLYFDATNNKINDLSMDLSSAGDLIFQENAMIVDEVKIKNGELNANSHVTLVSDAIKTASIQEIEGTGIITGDLTVQRYLNPKGKIYRYIATSVEGVTVADWQASFPITGGFTGESPGYTSAASMYMYDNGQWQAYPPSIGSNLAPINRGIGYSAYLRNGTSPITLHVTGNPFQGDIPFDLDPDPSSVDTNDGWNLVGNPYASTIKWGLTGWLRSGVSSSVSVRDNPTGVFQYYDYATGLGTLTQGEIAPGQAFWVQSISATPSLTITEKAKSTDQQSLYREADDQTSHITMLLKQGTKEDHTFVAFTEYGTDEFDAEFDAIKQQNVGLYNFSTLSSNNVDIAINNMADKFCSKTIKLNLQNTTAGSYTLVFNEVESLVGVGKIMLHDNFTAADFEVTDGAEYNFAISSNKNSFGTDRLSLTFSRPTLNSTLDLSAANICGNGYASIAIANSQKGVEYFAVDNNNKAISEIVSGNGDQIMLQIPSSNLSLGSNAVKVSTGFKGCDNLIIEGTTTFEYTQAPTALTPGEVTVCEGSSASLTAEGAPANGRYQWYNKDGLMIDGATTSNFTTRALINDIDFYVSAVTENGCEGAKQHTSVFVETFDIPTIEFTNDTLFASAYGSLQWLKNGEPISGATSNFLVPYESGSYSVEALGDCSHESLPIEYLVTGVEPGNARGLNVTVFPNPAKNGNLNIKINASSNGSLDVRLVDLLGKSVYAHTFDEAGRNRELKLSPKEPLSNGVYLIRISQGNAFVLKKVIISE